MKRRRPPIGKFLVFAGLLIIGGLFGWGFGHFGFTSASLKLQQSEAQTPASSNTVKPVASIMLDFGDGTIDTIDIAPKSNERLLDILKRAAKDKRLSFSYKEFKGLGLLVEEIGGRRNTNDRYWQYWVNNRFAAVGADSYVVQPGDIIEWKYTASQPIK